MSEKDINYCKAIISGIGGWLSIDEGILLYNFAKNNKGGVIVEIGSWQGKSTCWLGFGTKAGDKQKIYAIDPHVGSIEHKPIFGDVKTEEIFKHNLSVAAIEDVVVPIIKKSEDAAKTFDKKVGFIFIDGDHAEDQVQIDFDVWYPKLIEGGVMAFHDSRRDPGGPKHVVEKHLLSSGKFKECGYVDSITFGVKSSKITSSDKIRNKFVLGMKRLTEFAANDIWLPRFVKNIGKKFIQIFIR